MKQYVLSISKIDYRILGACIKLSNSAVYEGMPIVGSLPEGNLTDYIFVDGEYIYDPLPEPEPSEPTPTQEERIAALEAQIDMLLSGVTEDE